MVDLFQVAPLSGRKSPHLLFNTDQNSVIFLQVSPRNSQATLWQTLSRFTLFSLCRSSA
jgi:hypothetical protein